MSEIKDDKIKITFIDSESKEEKNVFSPVGMSVLEVAKQNDVNIEGACNGGLACSTCHVHVADKKMFDILPKASEEEEDMLDLAFDIKDVSRLCCQIMVTKQIDGITFKIPKSSNINL